MRIGFDDWQDTLLGSLPGASLPAVKLQFWNTARDFYRRSRAWRETMGAFTLRAGQPRVPLSPVDQNAEVCFLEAVTIEGAPLYLRVGSSLEFFAEGLAPGMPRSVMLEDPHSLILTPPPDQTYERALRIEVSVQPRRGSEALPEFAATHHFRALEVGTMGRLLAQANKPWSDVASSVQLLRTFEVELARARNNAECGYGKEALRWRYHNAALR